jgi:hypothetical protein
MQTVSGFFDLDAMNFVECPRCRLPAGKICIDHRGKKLTKVHPERAADYRARFKDRASLYIDGPVQIERFGSTTGSWSNEKPPAIVPGVFAVYSPSTAEVR